MNKSSNNYFKGYLAVFLCLVMSVCLTGCSGKQEKRYSDYIKSLIAINYLGAKDDYIKATGANKEDAEALYRENMEHLADNILAYYGVTISDASGAKEGFVTLAKNVYSKINYKVDKAKKQGDSYTVDVTIYPINLFNQTREQVVSYVDRFNRGISQGDYNDYTLEEYETEFSEGLLEILNEGCSNMTYGEPVVVTVTIIEEDNLYYISDEDFLAIDAAMISTSEVVDSATPADAQ